MIRLVVFFCFGTAGVVASAAAQPPPPPPPPPGSSMTMATDQPETDGTAAISGIVTDGVSGLPIEGALIALGGGTPGAPARPRQVTDGRGRFVFTHVPAGTYFVTVSRPGYLDGGYLRIPGTNASVRITVADAEWFRTADVRLWKPSVIGGAIRDERGDPLVGIPVRLLSRARVAGVDRWIANQSTTTDDRGVYRLAELLPGEYIVHVPSVQVTLPGGEVSLYRPQGTAMGSAGAVAPSGSREVPDVVRSADGLGVQIGHFATPAGLDKGVAYPMTFFPSARSMDQAERVTVSFGDVRTDVDVHVRPAPTVSLSGQVIGSPEVVANLPVRLVPRGSEGMGSGSEAAITKTDAQGAFTLQLVPQGDYTIIASRMVTEYTAGGSGANDTLPRGADLFVNRSSSTQVAGTNGISARTQGAAGVQVHGRTTVSVGDRALTGITIPLAGSVTVSGHFLWDGAEAPPAGVFLPTVMLEPADADIAIGLPFGRVPRPAAGETLPRATFTIENVLPGQYLIGRLLGSGWSMAGVELNGRDVSATPLVIDGERPVTGLVIRMTSQQHELSGSVRDESGAVINEGAVFVFPATPALWRTPGLSGLRFHRIDLPRDGRYNATGLLPGDYFVAAVPFEHRLRIHDPAFLESIAGQASRVTIAPGSKVTQDLRLIGRR